MPSRLSPANAPGMQHGLRYLGGSVACALVNNLVLIGVDALGYALAVGVLLSWLLGGATGFLWHAILTYRTKPTLAAFARFMGGVLIGLPIAWALLWFFHDFWGWPMALAAPVATLVLFAYHWLNAFVALRWDRVRAYLAKS